MDEQQVDEQQASLIDRAVRRLSSPERGQGARPRPAIDWRIASALAGLIALGPLLTIVGAGMLERQAQAATAQALSRAAPRMKAADADRAARAALRGTVREASVAVWLDRVALALPDDARLAGMRRTADGQVAFDVIAPDPDSLRSAIRRDPVLAGFREQGQRRAGAMILISYRRAP